VAFGAGAEDLPEPCAEGFRVLEADTLSLVVLKVVVRVALLLHKREAEHDGLVQVICNRQNHVPAQPHTRVTTCAQTHTRHVASRALVPSET
jgi:hypothetical protein